MVTSQSDSFCFDCTQMQPCLVHSNFFNHSVSFLFPKGYFELKHFPCNNYRAQGMSEGNVTMSNPNYCV
jgi:hypothetical protein